MSDASVKFYNTINKIVLLRLGGIGAEQLDDDDVEYINTCNVLRGINNLMYTYVTHNPLKSFNDYLKQASTVCRGENKDCVCHCHNFD